MNKVTLNGQKIVDSITEGYPVTVIREDGFRYIHISLDVLKENLTLLIV